MSNGYSGDISDEMKITDEIFEGIQEANSGAIPGIFSKRVLVEMSE